MSRKKNGNILEMAARVEVKRVERTMKRADGNEARAPACFGESALASGYGHDELGKFSCCERVARR